ncbi:metallophosphoesterase [Acetobacterium paludosum]|uniref:metallophosphoesterase n=1 Tax=Acetobacterium paludosum TaxID=52693 RepID=UPI00242FF93B|nr:metallophosphoesterase [Acetobacterium paludosum]
MLTQGGNKGINFVIVTGDFDNYSKTKTFEKSADFLKRLMETLELEITKDLFIVPGNHDCCTPIEELEEVISSV